MVNPRFLWNTRRRPACRSEDPELFFPVGDSGPALVLIAKAKAVCGRCPLQRECREWAVGNGESAGVWGGLTEEERRALSRRATVTGGHGTAPPAPPDAG
ncbi:WhiB family transcriptional regulator [Streptomyces sp. NPDC012751]|uniref:WhiB family transcriptional regulator n=1 Tax=unclassified Streptomyces TaxID=2593676 RepID=UPI000699D6A3|nr:WhiB family transcriptional regulator [Streptomyces sp. NRRL S-31]